MPSNYFLGSGNFGEVFRGSLNHTTVTNVALKFLRDPNYSGEFYKEATVASHLKHENIVRFIGICKELSCIILELMEGGQLLSFLRASGRCALNLIDLIDMINDIISGCAYLQQKRYVHRDLAARNCMMTSTDPLSRKVYKA